jgi:hypothetical protein
VVFDSRDASLAQLLGGRRSIEGRLAVGTLAVWEAAAVHERDEVRLQVRGLLVPDLLVDLLQAGA